MNPFLRPLIEQKLGGLTFSASQEHFDFQSVGGGSINEAWRISNNSFTAFCKLNSATEFPQLFQKEAAGLQLLSTNGSLKTPRVLDCFEARDRQILLLEWIEPGERTEAFWKTFGEGLARMHEYKGSRYGWDTDNYMGSVPQQNAPLDSWTEFFFQRRLLPLCQLCASRLPLADRRRIEALGSRLSEFFAEKGPVLLHGDLWSGNFLCSRDEDPVLIDPAVYFGHPAVDLGMTTLFGGFHPLFYQAYRYHAPRQTDALQWEICNLYPLLIHLYLFGTGYLSAIQRILQQID